MKKLIYDSALLLLGCLLWTGCNNDEDLTVYSTEGAKTELGQKIIVGSDGYVGQYFSDTTYTLAPGVKALEMEILSATGMAVKMFVLEVDSDDEGFVSQRRRQAQDETTNDVAGIGTRQTGQPCSGCREW